jgi:hypothetical protein
MILSAYSDSDWAGDLDERKSRSEYLILLNTSPIIWVSKLQVSVALSSTEAEYVALSLTSRDVIWLRSLLFNKQARKYLKTISHVSRLPFLQSNYLEQSTLCVFFYGKHTGTPRFTHQHPRLWHFLCPSSGCCGFDSHPRLDLA